MKSAKEYTRSQICDMADKAHEALTEFSTTTSDLYNLANDEQQFRYNELTWALRRLVDEIYQGQLNTAKSANIH